MLFQLCTLLLGRQQIRPQVPDARENQLPQRDFWGLQGFNDHKLGRQCCSPTAQDPL